MKTINDLLKTASLRLLQNGAENSSEEARMLLESAGGPSKKEQIINGVTEVDDTVADLFSKFIEERLEGRPLQYILGEWDFYGNMFSVGEGVLIPRAETEILIDEADAYLKNFEGACVLDLCAGTGCVGITLALHNPSSRFYLIEKSDEAFVYLRKNASRYNLKNVSLVKGDIFEGAKIIDNKTGFGALISNPPYIPAGELETLQKEVKREPRLALDGGSDGLNFYRAICELWLPLLKKDALVCLECGENQTEEVGSLLSRNCENITVKKDFNGLPRTVTANYRGE
ncbi:MAG: peptide chain release factor N(5)-glutamine methyltransferase [Clostridia bacterium]|nr:peptide chain release factor N(5)-glutamine methyltransferase [Clostridia bacterium]